MKLFAQHGAQAGEKIAEGLSRDLIDGVIFSPRDIGVDTLRNKLDEIATNSPSIERLLDPQLYAVFLNGSADARLGYLAEDYASYFRPRRRAQLERESQVRADVTAALEFQKSLQVSAFISPNVFVPRTLNSVEAVIAKNFIRSTAEAHAELSDPRRVFATLAISREALLDKQELTEFVNEITALDHAPNGFYLLIAARSSEARSDVFHADVIAGWMYLNHALRLNGFEVLNGYSDIVTPFLGAAGGNAGALGWWSNLRAFSLDRFAPAGSGGRLPIQRYLSTALLNRITYFELDQLRSLAPEVVNNLPTDSLYPAVTGSAPERNKEVLQSWETVRVLNSRLVNDDQVAALQACLAAIANAQDLYEEIPLPLDTKSNAEHLEPLREGIGLFARLAEIEIA
jgi:hypothetical protein